MGLIEAVVLGLVQGITEFLPVSSTAHLRLAPELFGWKDPGAAYSAVIQLGTTTAVIVYFWRDLIRIAIAMYRGVVAKQPFATPDAKLGWGVVLGTIPIGIAGLALKDLIEKQFRSLYVIALSLIILAIVLFIVERLAKHQRTINDITLKDSIIVGCCQAVALIPGSSRSGTTLTGALFLGFKREDAARFSFLLSIPATVLAGVFELKHLMEAPDRPVMALVVGTIVAFASGLAAIAGLLRLLRAHTTLIFVGYRIALGVLLLVLLQSGVLKPQSGIENVSSDAAANTKNKQAKD